MSLGSLFLPELSPTARLFGGVENSCYFQPDAGAEDASSFQTNDGCFAGTSVFTIPPRTCRIAFEDSGISPEAFDYICKVLRLLDVFQLPSLLNAQNMLDNLDLLNKISCSEPDYEKPTDHLLHAKILVIRFLREVPELHEEKHLPALYLTALAISVKLACDEVIYNSDMASQIGLSHAKLTLMEREFFSVVDWDAQILDGDEALLDEQDCNPFLNPRKRKRADLLS